MKKIIAVLLSALILLTGCGLQEIVDTSSEVITSSTIEQPETSEIYEANSSESIVTEIQFTDEYKVTTSTQATANTMSLLSIDTTSEEYVNSLGFTSLNDSNLMRYVEDTVYTDLVNQLNSDKYFVENIETVYISKEYIEELEYNSQENIFFGYKLSELDEAFQGKEYIFTLGENGQTDVVPFEECDESFDEVIRNVAVGTGVILVCVTVSAISGGVGAPAVSMIFAASAKSATSFALSSGVISGVTAGVVEGIKTNDFDKALKTATLKGSEGFMWGACTGALTGGASEAIALKGATLNGLTMNEAATIQKETKYPIDVIKQFSNMEQFEICKKAGLTAEMVSGKTALIRNIDLNFVDEATGMTNLQLMQQGKAAIDPISGLPYELHHIGQKADSTLAILTKAEHMQNGNNKIWHILGKASEAHAPGNTWDTQRIEFWKNMANLLVA